MRRLFTPRSTDRDAAAVAVTTPGQGEFGDIAVFYDHLMSSVSYRSWVDYVEAILDRRVARPQRVLDLCCGTGKVGAEMLRRGHSVVGADLSEPMVRRCGLQTRPLPAAVQDACELGFQPGSMDLVVCLFDSLNYITKPERLAACFREVYEVLAPRGLFVFDLNTRRALSIGLFNQSSLTANDPLVYSWEAHWDPATRLCRVDMWFQWRGDHQPHEVRETHWQYAYETHEVLAMLGAAGFVSITPYDAYTFHPPHRKSDRLYYVARKE